ncbi:Dihydrofolate synthase @ Folylpolyglutamate synthase [hydrothermal vent metagenome]|uniref:Dihydrofolate synthase @ Folylpolyglutamate synthase n=1 Tax=hydrothermal vent metagenome TaxID=652676 RepID=A0A1W1C8G2_9ZZZZ
MEILSIIEFLAQKPLYYKEIDHERVQSAYRMLQPHISRPGTIHVVGTNGKGSTGRMIAHLAFMGADSREQGTGMSVGHYTSPHILTFNERIWLNGEDASDEVLESAHQRLFAILGKEMSEALTYFEYTTLLAFVVFEKCDLMVLEAGLGGEFDATNVCDKELSVITPIGIDHQAFLGESIAEIANTKIRSIQKKVLLAPQPYEEVVEVAERIVSDVGASLVVARNMDDIYATEFEKNILKLENIAKQKGWPKYLSDNALVAIQALEILQLPYDVDTLSSLELFGRFYPIAENIRIDVGHNPLAAGVVAEAMEPDTVLVYNSLDDKEYEKVLRILKPKVKRVEIIRIDSQRATTLENIEKALNRIDISYRYFEHTIDKKEHYLVFGSFYTVEAFLKSYGDNTL